MRDADTPPQEPANHPHTRARLTPRQQATLIRAAAAEVYERVQEWRNKPAWRDSPTNAHRYQTTLAAVVALEALPEPASAGDLLKLVDTVRPLLDEWRASRPGPEQQIFAAVERLRQACR